MARFFFDEGFSRKVAPRLRDIGHNILTVDEAQRKGANDEEQVFFAQANNRILVAYDGYFYLIHRTLRRWGVIDMHAGILIVPDTLSITEQARVLDIFAASELPAANELYYWDADRSWIRYR